MDRDIPPVYVVRHLLHCSKRGEQVNKEVYRFLNDKVNDEAISQLEGEACLLLPNEEKVQYVRTDQVFWGEHPFGKFRFGLGSDLRRYDALFNPGTNKINIKQKIVLAAK